MHIKPVPQRAQMMERQILAVRSFAMVRVCHFAASAALLVLPLFISAGASAQVQPRAAVAASLLMPSSLELRHRQLQLNLTSLVRGGGRTGMAARELDRVLRPHLLKEELLALPLLGLLPSLASGIGPADPAAALAMAERFRTEMPGMLREHQHIAAALGALRAAAQADGNDGALAFADQLAALAAEEEQIHYPAALLVGAYLRIRR
jgi:hypothetical protein